MKINEITREIIGAAIKIHRRLGPGLLESAYATCLTYELERAGLSVQRHKAVPLVYEGIKLECAFRADMLVDERVIVEVRSREVLHPVDQTQLLSYLRLLNVPVGLLINFYVVLLRDGIKRMVNHPENFVEEPGLAGALR